MFSESVENPTAQSITVIERVAARIYTTQANLQDWTHKYIENHKTRIAVDLDILENWTPKDAQILELGCAPYIFTLGAREAGFKVRGLDIKPERFREFIEANNLEVIECDFEREKLPAANNSTDTVVINEVFEHMRIDLNFTFKEVFRVLKPGGRLFISTPNLRSATGIYNFLRKNRSYTLCGSIYREYSKLHSLGHMGHVREYTLNDITEFLSDVGFVPTGVYWRGGGI